MRSADYPLSEKHPDLLKSPSGIPYRDISLDGVLKGTVREQDLRVTSEALELQAQIADSAGRRQLAENLRRAAELVNVPESEILRIYNALRPGRGTRVELCRLADEMESHHGARRCAALIREAAGACGNAVGSP